MKERPILFTGEMVRAIQDGCKKQTRRVIIHQGRALDEFAFYEVDGDEIRTESGKRKACPYGKPGDRLYVKESCRLCSVGDEDGAPLLDPPVWYYADGDPGEKDRYAHLRTGRYVPKWAARLWLEVSNVRVERVQEISAEDVAAEGLWDKIAQTYHGELNSYDRWGAKRQFEDLWNSINAKRGYGWDANPWVWVLEFKLGEASK